MFRFTIRDVLWLTVIAALLVGWWKESAAADPRQTSSAEKKSTPLEGEWEVFSANYGTSGKAYYTFRGDQLTIEAWTSTEKRIDAPTTKSVEKWRVDIDSSKSPQRLVMNSVERQGKAEGPALLHLRDSLQHFFAGDIVHPPALVIRAEFAPIGIGGFVFPSHFQK